ncbi:cutinase family protein [Nocardia puris]|uniref:cutinase family protein n=1 Tax=Nocardia puris TaxID=208602 RepID=UPI001896098A|nr:cutinase family protein [Nocardia puris]MBF6216314.1 cutinase family protein [Nocardia puris]
MTTTTAGVGGRAVSVVVAGVVAAAVIPAVVWAGPTTAPIEQRCPRLYAIGMQGPGDGDASGRSDTGALSAAFGPMRAEAANLAHRLVVPFPADAPDGHATAVEAAVADLETVAADVRARCPATALALGGYEQGAQAVSELARRIGRGQVPGIAAEAVAAVALIAHPGRGLDSPILPGRAGRATPDAPAGTSGEHVAAIRLPALTGTGGGGLDPADTDYGALAGRVAEICAPADLACDTPAGTPLAQTIATIRGRANLADPITAIASIAEALATTLLSTTVGIVTEDLRGTSLDQLSYQPQMTLGQRLAHASDPATPVPGPAEVVAALVRLGTIGLASAVTVARRVLTPATITELAAVGLTNPAAALGMLATKVGHAIVALIPPRTAIGWVADAFDAITSVVTDNAQIAELSTRATYSDPVGRRSGYAATTDTGESRLAAVGRWFAAAARDLDAAQQGNPPQPPRTPSATKPAPSQQNSTVTPSAPVPTATTGPGAPPG